MSITFGPEGIEFPELSGASQMVAYLIYETLRLEVRIQTSSRL